MSSKLANGGDRLQTLRSSFKALNTQFASWVQEQAQKCPGEDWSDGVQDYLDYRKQLASEFDDCIDGDKNQGFTAPLPPSSAAPPAPTAPPPHPIFSVTASANPVTTGASLFGALPSTAVPGLSSEPKFGSFGQPAAGPLSFGTAATNMAGAANEGDEEEGPSAADQANYKPEVEADESAGAVLFKAKAKALILHNKTWEKKAVGMLTLRKPMSGRPFVTIGTDAGRSLLTATIPSKGKIMANASNTKVYGIYFSGVYTIPTGEDGPKGQQGNIMFQVQPDKGPDLKAQLEKIAAS